MDIPRVSGGYNSGDMNEPKYRSVAPHLDLVTNEHAVLSFWKQREIFDQTLAKTAGGQTWTAFEGPPTANGTPGTHHIEARTFKDILPRFKTMQGFYVGRRAGWDCHGLPVEIAVEKELGFNGKPDIEAFGIAAFNEQCRTSVTRHVDQWQDLTSRMGYWVDLDHPYKTMDRQYIESVWWSLKQIHERGLLEEDYRVAPYCPRCGTALSDHELAQGYEEDADVSVYVRFPLLGDALGGGVSLIAWTTTPWTLPSNTAIAVHPDGKYVVVTDGTERLLVAADATSRLFDMSLWHVQEQLRGHELIGLHYRPPFDLVKFPSSSNSHLVVGAQYVTSDSGSGLVHIAPAFGAEDLAVARANDLPIVNPIGPDGRFYSDVDIVGDLFFSEADPVVVAELDRAGLLFQELALVHQYPHCWRCHTKLLYYALPSWYIRTTKVRDRMLAENEKVTWLPESVKHGRFGEWLQNNVDWALSRSRYWGTPLPVWRNDETQAVVVVGSMAELGSLAQRDLSDIDPHRPYIDDVTFAIEGEAGVYRRVPDVIDAWYDSGAMPFAQWGYPHVEGSVESFEASYPAQFISEAIDQTRGWFYSLMAVGTAVFDRNAYENVVSLGHILAEDGRKMSKHLGNIVLPIPLMDQHGADAVRWFMACSGSPWAARLVGDKTLDEIVRKVLRTYWSAVSFQSLYGSGASWKPTDTVIPLHERPDLDRWVVGEAHRLVRDVTEDLEVFDTQRAGARITEFLDSLSNWYIRRSRRRFWQEDPSALASLHEALRLVTLVMAPFVPFITERVWADMFYSTTDTDTVSVHLAPWPVSREFLIDDELDSRVTAARRIVEIGRSARKAAGVKIRQPMRRALVSTNLFSALSPDLRAEVSAELNVLDLNSFEGAGEIVSYSVRPNFRTLGKRFGSSTQTIASAISSLDSGHIAAELLEHGTFEMQLPNETLTIGLEEVIISEEPNPGWAILEDQGAMIALDLEIDDDLLLAGTARDVVRAIQGARKDSGFEIRDRIHLRWNGTPAVAAAFFHHGDLISSEVLAVSMTEDPNVARFTNDELGLRFEVIRTENSD